MLGLLPHGAPHLSRRCDLQIMQHKRDARQRAEALWRACTATDVEGYPSDYTGNSISR